LRMMLNWVNPSPTLTCINFHLIFI
jgi:hypothetical protein